VLFRSFHLATHRLLLDNGTLQQGDKALTATARPATAILSRATFEEFGETITVTGNRGSITIRAQLDDTIADDVIWLPTNSTGNGLWADLTTPGQRV
jgi:NADH-quinone oxidoreductase subunit G